MQTFKAIKTLGPLDMRSVGRDAMLRWMIALPLFVALPARLSIPIVLARLGAIAHADLAAYQPVIVAYALLLITPVVYGLVVGFLLLDQRDDRTLMALQVTPMPLPVYLTYRLALPMLLGVAMTLVAFPIAGLPAGAELLLAALAAAPLAPLTALFLGAFAENKVQGFALVKGLSVLLLAPLGAYIVPPAWRIAFGMLPTFWPIRLYWALLAGEPLAWLYLPGGLAYSALLLWLLLRRFDAVIHR